MTLTIVLVVKSIVKSKPAANLNPFAVVGAVPSNV